MRFFVTLHGAGDAALLVLRIALCAIFWAHGRMKKGTWKMQPSDQLPSSMLTIIRTLSIAEPLGAAAIVLGLLTQVTAFGFCIVMLAAIPARRKQGVAFLAKDTTGWELDFLILAASIAMVVFGGGQYSLDRLLFGI
jgi:putative oxidoreductase